MKKSSKLKEIAQNVGVSQSTVSKALNNATDISAETRERILCAAVKMGYKTDYLPAKNINTIGVICPEIKSNYYTQIVTAIEENITRKDCGMTIAFTDFKYENEQKILKNFADHDFAGIIILTENNDIKSDLMKMKTRIKKPVVVITLDIKIDEFDTLLIDDESGVNMLVEHLTELGHTNIGFISDAFTLGRLEHFKKEMRRKGLETDENNIYIDGNCRRFEECGYAGAASILEILGKKNMPTAIITGYDNIAIGAMRLFKERKLRIPEDISIAGIDNISVTPYLPVSLTTVAVPVEEMGEIATRILFRKIQEPNYTLIQRVILRPRLIVRESTCALKTDKK